MKLQLVLCVTAASVFSPAALANCEGVWGPPPRDRGDITCTPLTDATLVSLEGASRAEVIEVMKATGRPLGPGEEDVLHFVGASDDHSGDVNFAFKNDAVVRIFGFLDTGDKFVWNPSATGPGRAILHYR
jgi:hypothetical protein